MNPELTFTYDHGRESGKRKASLETLFEMGRYNLKR